MTDDRIYASLQRIEERQERMESKLSDNLVDVAGYAAKVDACQSQIANHDGRITVMENSMQCKTMCKEHRDACGGGQQRRTTNTIAVIAIVVALLLGIVPLIAK